MIESGDLVFGNGSVRRKGLQNAGGQRGIDFFIELQEHQADLIAMWKKPVAAGMRDLFHQALGAQLPEVITESSASSSSPFSMATMIATVICP